MSDDILSYWHCALLGCFKTARYKVITSKTSFLTVCTFHVDAIRTMGMYPIEPLLPNQGLDYGWKVIRRENFAVGSEYKPPKGRVKYAKR